MKSFSDVAVFIISGNEFQVFCGFLDKALSLKQCVSIGK